MKDDVRASIAYIAGRLLTDVRSNGVFDYSRGHYVNIAGEVRPGIVRVFDYFSGCHIVGNGTPTKLNLFHYGRSSHVHLSIEKPKHFKGFDYGSGSHFSGQVAGNAVSVFDYGESSWFNYRL